MALRRQLHSPPPTVVESLSLAMRRASAAPATHRRSLALLRSKSTSGAEVPKIWLQGAYFLGFSQTSLLRKTTMARRRTIDDSEWGEVKTINGYAMFMGYLMMGVRGLGLLVITWTTVVLLGGFVSVLGSKDFWCLTAITLVQTAGVFNFILKEKLGDFIRSWWGLLGAAAATVSILFRKENDRGKVSTPRTVLAFVLSLVQALVLVIIVFPVVVFYVSGMYFSAGVALWRLVKQDHSNADGGSNLKPALEVLYSLAVAQGVIFTYRSLSVVDFKRRALTRHAIARLKRNVDEELVSEYLDATVEGCAKDPSFARGRNLVTHAVDLIIKEKSIVDIAGVKLLGSIISSKGHKALARHLLTSSSSFGHVIWRLLEIMGPRSKYSRDIREHAARIVALVSYDIQLQQFPRAIQCISSLFSTSNEQSLSVGDHYLTREYERPLVLVQEEYERHFLINECESGFVREIPAVVSNQLHASEGLVIKGMKIIWKLIAEEDNRRVVSNTDGLISKIIMVPLVLDRLHSVNHSKWQKKVQQSKQLESRLMCASAQTGTKLRQVEISSNSEAIFSNLINILECHKCNLSMKIKTVKILLELSVDTSFIKVGESSCRMFIWILLHIILLTDDETCSSDDRMNKTSDVRSLACEKLANMQFFDLSVTLPLPNEGNATSMLQSVRFAVGNLTEAFMDPGNVSVRLNAAEILGNLCFCYTKNDEYLNELKKAIVDVMPKVLEQIHCYGSIREQIEAVEDAGNIDVESSGVYQGVSSQQSKGKQHRELCKAFISLCKVVWVRLCPNLSPELNKIAKEFCLAQGKPVKEFAHLVYEVERNI